MPARVRLRVPALNIFRRQAVPCTRHEVYTAGVVNKENCDECSIVLRVSSTGRLSDAHLRLPLGL